jgi:hypothetical protein
MTEDEDHRFEARLNPRDGTDVLMGVALSVWILAIFAVLPLVVAWWWTGDLRTGRIVATIVLAVAAAFVFFSSIRFVALGPDGVRLTRYSGTERFLPWKDVKAIEEVARKEIFLRFWPFPGLPVRGNAISGTTRGQFRIDYEGGCCYFPPKDVDGFREAAAQRLKGG